ncbi:MAG TPA: GAF domain-containing protein [Pseudobdellovibrionaceae bacterium]|nr:GAF domain-containing protein [Pseudobdellovibrionaceae bacterium]
MSEGPYQFHDRRGLPKASLYRELQLEFSGLVGPRWLANCANLTSLIYHHVPDLNWAGFYFVDELANTASHLRLGPFHGLPACLDIQFSRGVCGAAARTREIQIVPDVEQFPGHIACDARSRSEIVIPLLLHRGQADEKLLGVLDLDSPLPNRFDNVDAEGLKILVDLLMEKSKWPSHWSDAF